MKYFDCVQKKSKKDFKEIKEGKEFNVVVSRGSC